VKIFVGYVVRVLVDERDSQVWGMLGKGTIATVTRLFPYAKVEVENAAGIWQIYPEDELQVLPLM
jgi:hypothetical protein